MLSYTDFQLARIMIIMEGANDHHLMKQSWGHVSAEIPEGGEVTKHIQSMKTRI